jgi:hypothetical protein
LTGTLTGDPMLGKLLSTNGGPTPTMALMSGSPAINAGTAALAPSTDQRGLGRYGNTDIGAYEDQNKISFSPPTPSSAVTFGVGPIPLTATSGSGAGSITFSVISGPGSISDNLLTVTGVGTIVIQANQAGDTPTQQTLVVGPASQTITFGSLTPVTYGVGTVPPGATSSSGLPVTYSVLSGPGSISDNTLTVTGAGSIVIRADQAGDANHTAASYELQTLVVNKADAIVNVTAYTVTYDGQPHTATYTITGVNGETGATVGTVTLNTTHTNAGIYSSDSWNFTGTANYNNIAATTITDTINQAALTVNPPSPTPTTPPSPILLEVVGSRLRVLSTQTGQVLSAPLYFGDWRVVKWEIVTDADGLPDVIFTLQNKHHPKQMRMVQADGIRLMGLLVELAALPKGSVVAATLEGDGFLQFIVGTHRGGVPAIDIYSGRTGRLLRQFNPFPPGLTGVAHLSLQPPALVVSDAGQQTVVLDLATLL